MTVFVVGATIQTQLSLYLDVLPQFSKSVNEAFTEAELVPGSCTFEHKQLYM